MVIKVTSIHILGTTKTIYYLQSVIKNCNNGFTFFIFLYFKKTAPSLKWDREFTTTIVRKFVHIKLVTDQVTGPKTDIRNSS